MFGGAVQGLLRGDVLFLKLLMVLGLDSVVRWKFLTLEIFFQFVRHIKAEGAESGLCDGWGTCS